MLDLSIFRNTLDLDESELQNDCDIFNRFESAVYNLDPAGSIGWKEVKEERDYTDDDRIVTSESLTLVIQSRGQGKKPQDFSDLLFEHDEPEELED